VIATVAAIGEIFIFFFAGQYAGLVGKVTAFALLTIVALAALMIGGFGGFLFGIPRRLQEAAPSVQPPASGTPLSKGAERSLYAGNTNLEQISDWLTKIIVGIGLVEATKILDFVVGLGESVATSLGQPRAQIAFPVAAIVLLCDLRLHDRIPLGAALPRQST
jgi:hypothetical protein